MENDDVKYLMFGLWLLPLGLMFIAGVYNWLTSV